MSEMAQEQLDALKAAIEKMSEGLQDYLNVISDEGEPEVTSSAVVLFESRGMAAQGIFSRVSYLLLEQSALTSMLGMLDIAGEKVQHALRCAGHVE